MKKRNSADYITEFFRWDELASNDGVAVPAKYRKNAIDLATEATIGRAILGNRPWTVLSGYRSPAWNRKVGGAEKSQHLLAKAMDIIVARMTPLEVYTKLDAAMKTGALHNGGLGLYDTFVHFDVRSRPARWDERKKR